MVSYQDWHIPYHQDELTLQDALDSMSQVKSDQAEIPLMVRLVENPKFQLPGFALFHGAVDLFQHDCIHIALGRGLLNMDEAFTIGFTMGSTNKVTTTEENLYALINRYFYPNVYSFNEDEIAVFRDAVKLAYISSCTALDQFDFNEWLDQPLQSIRDAIGLEQELMMAYFAVEQRRYPRSPASQRLLPRPDEVVAF